MGRTKKANSLSVLISLVSLPLFYSTSFLPCIDHMTCHPGFNCLLSFYNICFSFLCICHSLYVSLLLSVVLASYLSFTPVFLSFYILPLYLSIYLYDFLQSDLMALVFRHLASFFVSIYLSKNLTTYPSLSLNVS